jgi:hypothetical protein
LYTREAEAESETEMNMEEVDQGVLPGSTSAVRDKKQHWLEEVVGLGYPHHGALANPSPHGLWALRS